ncbi:hypothetical protein BJX63DRAFT_381350 [Aspergillus granulosus]|uniref:Uncharacterized protein n=1 Tax=Aspergillus granulosus TaxID=176169 RepID=A0ABR4HYE4_9EURO
MPLLSLAQSILEEILILALDLPLPAPYTLDGTSRTLPIGVLNSQAQSSTKEFLQTANSLLLASRQLHAATAPLIYSRTVFDVGHIGRLAAFLDAIGARNRQCLRYVTLYLERGDEDEDGGGRLSRNNSCPRLFEEEDVDEVDMTAAFLRKVVETLSRLPASLRGLWVYFPFQERWLAVNQETGRVHPLLRSALQRFSCIETLVIVGCPHDVPWDILYIRGPGQGTGEAAEEEEEGETKPTSAFPFLKALHLDGRLQGGIDGVELTTAVSEEVLPALTYLEVQGLDDGVGQNIPITGESSFAEAIRALRPLQVFQWSRGSESQSFRGPPKTQCLMDSHIHALISRHGCTLREVKIDLAGHLARDYARAITDKSLVSILVSLSSLQSAAILAPFLDFIKLLRRIADSHPQTLQRAITPSLKSLRLTLGVEEEPLQTALDTSQVAALCLRTNLWRISHLRLRLVVGSRPEIHEFGSRDYKIHRNNLKRYIELEKALAACIKGCLEQHGHADGVEGQTVRKAQGRDWCELSLVDVYDYSPFWYDSVEQWREEDVYAEGPHSEC